MCSQDRLNFPRGASHKDMPYCFYLVFTFEPGQLHIGCLQIQKKELATFVATSWKCGVQHRNKK